MTVSQDIDIRRKGRAGRITLTRPKALNALTIDMAMALGEAVAQWQADGDVGLIVLDAEGEKAFCAGGDVARICRAGREGDFDEGRRFFANEYRMNATVANCAIPYVALMDGIIMGGGVGIGGHASHRVVTERSMVAMPECAIGLVPDVGTTRLLAGAPGHLGEFLGLTGWRMTAADAIFAGFADMQVASGDVSRLASALEERAEPGVIDSFVQEPGEAPLPEHMAAIDRHFAHASALECVQSLEADGSEFAQEAAKLIRRGCPLSAACTFELVRRARSFSRIEENLALEYRFTYRAMSHGEFLEGVRAQLIDKDRNPQWATPCLEDVTDAMIETMLAPLGEDELEL